MEILKKLDDFLKSTIEKEEIDGKTFFRMKIMHPETKEVYNDARITAEEFAQQYFKMLSMKRQLETSKAKVEADIQNKIWETWPEKVKNTEKEISKIQKQLDGRYVENYKEVKEVIPSTQLRQMAQQFRVEDLI